MSNGKPKIYKGRTIAIGFEAGKCIHSRHCVLGNPKVFVANAPGDWIQPDAASAEAIAALARQCPSGAITYERLDGGEPEPAPLVNTVKVLENGPLAFHADQTIVGHGECLRSTLCRCGASNNKPFCDGSHAKIDFVATGEPVSVESTPLAERAGKLAITPVANGPLQVEGNLELCSGTGRTINRTEKTWLCRCGASEKKPYCDGSHKKIGFAAP